MLISVITLLMYIIFIFVFFFSIPLYSYTPGFKTFPIKPYSNFITYYLQPVEREGEKNFLVIKCAREKKKAKPFCEVFSSVYFSLSSLEAIAVDLEKWDSYYLGLDVGVFVGAFFQKIRSWVWRNPIGRVVGVLALTGEVSDFVVSRKQGVVYAVVSEIDQKQAELRELKKYALPKSLEKKESSLGLKNKEQLLPSKLWIPLKGFDLGLINQLLNLVGNI